MMKVYPATQIKLENLSWFLYGSSGSGKTTLIGTFPSPIAIINPTNEKGALTLRGHPKVTVIDIDSPQDMNEALNWLVQHHKEFRTIAVDGWTMFLEMLISAKKAENGGKGIVEQQHWYIWGGQILAMIERFRKLPVEMVYTAGLAAVQDEVGTGRHGGPALFKWLSSRLPHKMECMIFMDCVTDGLGRPTYRAHLSGSGTIIGRIRGAAPAGMIEMPTYAKIMEKVKDPLFKSAEPTPPVDPPPLAIAKPEEVKP